MKHSYIIGCGCERCTKECARRSAQSAADIALHPPVIKRTRRRRVASRRPVWGSQEWAETRGDDID